MTKLAMNNPETAEASSTTLNLLSGTIYATFAAVKSARSFEQAHGFHVTLWDLLQIYERMSQQCHPLIEEMNALEERMRAKAQQSVDMAPEN